MFQTPRIAFGLVLLATVASSLSVAAAPPAESEIVPPAGCPYDKDRDVWDLCTIQGSKVGYTHTQVSRAVVDGRTLVKIQVDSRLAIVRFGASTELGSELTSFETPDGRLVEFVEIRRLGPTPVRAEGRVEGGRLVVKQTSAGKTHPVSLPWSNLDGGYQAIEFSLAARPMKPGETRCLRTLVAGFDQIATVRLVAREVEPTPLLRGTYQLLRIDNTTWLAGQPLEGALWANQKGEILKTRMNVLQQETFRCSRAEAMDETGLGKIDLGLDTVVPVERAIPDPHATRRIRYRVTLADGDPTAALVAGGSQQVKSLRPDTAEVTVVAVRPGQPAQLVTPPADRPTPDDVRPNSLVQSDDPGVRAMAAEAAEGATDAWAKAVALERYVHRAVRTKSLSHALASAAEVAQTREGDCTEHAVLLAAMARAVDLPARVAIGLVYFDREEEPRHAFGYHMWTEIHVGDRWIPMDATLGLGGIGAAHLKLAHGNLKDANVLGSFLPVVNVLGRIKIEVLEVE